MAIQTIKTVEASRNAPRPDTLSAIQGALEEGGVEFTRGSGVRVRDDSFRLIEGPEPYLVLLDDVFQTLKGTGGEVLFLFVDNEKSPQAVIDSGIRMRHDGLKFRFIINAEKPYCLFPRREYRGLAPEDFHNNPMIIYGDKVGISINGNQGAQITRNASVANAMRHIFEVLWRNGKMPAETTAKVTYD